MNMKAVVRNDWTERRQRTLKSGLMGRFSQWECFLSFSISDVYIFLLLSRELYEGDVWILFH